MATVEGCGSASDAWFDDIGLRDPPSGSDSDVETETNDFDHAMQLLVGSDELELDSNADESNDSVDGKLSQSASNTGPAPDFLNLTFEDQRVEDQDVGENSRNSTVDSLVSLLDELSQPANIIRQDRVDSSPDSQRCSPANQDTLASGQPNATARSENILDFDIEFSPEADEILPATETIGSPSVAVVSTQNPAFITSKDECKLVGFAAAADNITDNGNTMLEAPEAWSVSGLEIKRWLQTKPLPGQLYGASNGEYLIATELMSRRLIASCSDFYRMLFVKDDAEARREILDRFLVVKDFGDDYRNERLRGQRGVFARQRIRQDTVLGLFAGLLLKDDTATTKSSDLKAELCHLNKLSHHGGVTRRLFGKYAFALPLCAKFAAQSRVDSLVVSGLQRSNCLSLINGYRPEDNPENLINVMVQAVRMDAHAPVLLFITTRDITEDDQLILDYGADYFKPSQQESSLNTSCVSTAGFESESRYFNRFTRAANDANGDFILKCANVEEFTTAKRQLQDEGVAFSPHLELRVHLDEMAAAVARKSPITASATICEAKMTKPPQLYLTSWRPRKTAVNLTISRSLASN